MLRRILKGSDVVMCMCVCGMVAVVPWVEYKNKSIHYLHLPLWYNAESSFDDGQSLNTDTEPS